jgi:acetolactate synthase-1/2/3 large subunit
MASETRDMPYADATYAASQLGGDCAGVASALGAYAERVTEPSTIQAALRRAWEVTKQGHPALVEFITARETSLSTVQTPTP